MGLLYRKETGDIGSSKTSEAMRKLSQRPGRSDENGKPIYFTEQHHKDACDINNIIKKYDVSGVITHVSNIEAKFGDLTGMDFKTMSDQVANAQNMFNSLPAEIRNEFKNDPSQLLTFMENPDNRDKAIELGLINKHWTEETDGLGEHVDGKTIKNITKDGKIEETETTTKTDTK